MKIGMLVWGKEFLVGYLLDKIIYVFVIELND